MRCDFRGWFQGTLEVGSEALQLIVFESNINIISSDNSLMKFPSEMILDTNVVT